MLYNTGKKPVYSDNGLLTTVGFQLGTSSPAFYALEGSIASAGSAVNWWKNNLRLMDSPKEVDELVEQTQNNGGVFFVPAFGGLFAPYWREDARGTILGLTQFTTRGHVLRATLEAICFQTRAVGDMISGRKPCLEIPRSDLLTVSLSSHPSNRSSTP